MKIVTGAAIGALALAASLSFAGPAAARSNVGVYVGPNGIAISVERYREYCRDYYYRERHWDRCHQFYGSHYYPNHYYRQENRRHRHWDRVHRRLYALDFATLAVFDGDRSSPSFGALLLQSPSTFRSVEGRSKS